MMDRISISRLVVLLAAAALANSTFEIGKVDNDPVDIEVVNDFE